MHIEWMLDHFCLLHCFTMYVPRIHLLSKTHAHVHAGHMHYYTIFGRWGNCVREVHTALNWLIPQQSHNATIVLFSGRCSNALHCQVSCKLLFGCLHPLYGHIRYLTRVTGGPLKMTFLHNLLILSHNYISIMSLSLLALPTMEVMWLCMALLTRNMGKYFQCKNTIEGCCT